MARLEKIKKAVPAIKKQLDKEDYDWLHVNVGYEGVGKSTFGWHFCSQVDPNFNVNKVIFSYKGFKKALRDNNPGEAIMIDEGAFVLFHRDAMKSETKKMVKLLTGCRDFNQFIMINLPRFFILDNYVRKYRVKTSTRVIKRGVVLFYSPRKTNMVEKGKKGRANWPDYDFMDGFPKVEGEEWERYRKKKRTHMVGNVEEEEDEESKTKIEKIQDFYKDNPIVKQQEIARKFDVNPSYVSMALGRMDPEKRKKIEKKAEKIKESMDKEDKQ